VFRGGVAEIGYEAVDVERLSENVFPAGGEFEVAGGERAGQTGGREVTAGVRPVVIVGVGVRASLSRRAAGPGRTRVRVAGGCFRAHGRRRLRGG